MHWSMEWSEKLGCLFFLWRGSWACMQTVPLRCGEMCDNRRVFIVSIMCWLFFFRLDIQFRTPYCFFYSWDPLKFNLFVCCCQTRRHLYRVGSVVVMFSVQTAKVVLWKRQIQPTYLIWKSVTGIRTVDISERIPLKNCLEIKWLRDTHCNCLFCAGVALIIVHTYPPTFWTLSERINIFRKVSRIDVKLGEYVSRDVLVAKLHLGDGWTSLSPAIITRKSLLFVLRWSTPASGQRCPGFWLQRTGGAAGKED